jgi:hypothetical protein
MSESNLPLSCPSCSGQITVQTITCAKCETKVEGKFRLPALFNLSKDEQKLILDFLKCNGSPKRLAKQYETSYHMMRRRLDDLMARIELLESSGS